MIAPDEIEKLIRDGLGVDHLEVRDRTGGGNHFEVTVVSTEFEGKSRIAQHQLVYAALGDRMREQIHALAIRTFTPESWSAAS